MFIKTDLQLIEKALSGSERAWTKLVKRYQNEVYNHAYRMTGNSAEAFDLMQDIFLAVFRNLPSFRGDSKFRTWLYRIASNRGIDHLRKRREPFSNADVEQLEYGVDFHDELSQWQQNKVVLKLLNQLSKEQRSVLELKFYQEFTFEEIGTQLGISVNTAKTRLYSALENLRKVIGEDDVRTNCL